MKKMKLLVAVALFATMAIASTAAASVHTVIIRDVQPDYGIIIR